MCYITRMNIFSYNGDTLDAPEGGGGGGYHVDITLALPLLLIVTIVLSSHLHRKFSPAWFSAAVTVKDVEARNFDARGEDTTASSDKEVGGEKYRNLYR